MKWKLNTIYLSILIVISSSLFIIISNGTKERSAMFTLEKIGFKDQYKESSFNDCERLNNIHARDCFITYYLKLSVGNNINDVIDDIVSRVKEGNHQRFYSSCHQVAHDVGYYAAVTEYKDFPLGAMKLEPQVCATGFTHGVFQAYWGALSKNEMNSKAGVACENLGITMGYYRWTCNHILGHELVDRDPYKPKEQLENCLKIEDYNSKNDCLSGGWMQFFSSDAVLSKFTKEKLNASDIFSYCKSDVRQISSMCYQETFPALAMITNGDFKEDFILCSTINDPEFSKWCSYGVGRSVAVSSGYDMSSAVAMCKNNSGITLDYCLASSAASVTLNTGSARESVKVCEMIANQEVKLYCRDWVGISRDIQQSGPNKVNMPIV